MKIAFGLFAGWVLLAAGMPLLASDTVPLLNTEALKAPPYDWVGIIGTGQSLGVGCAPGGPLSTTQPFHNLKLLDSGPDPKYPIDGTGAPVWSAVPLTEPFRPKFSYQYGARRDQWF